MKLNEAISAPRRLLRAAMPVIPRTYVLVSAGGPA